MPSNTSRLGLQYPLSSDPANPPADFSTLANKIDQIVTGFGSGTSAPTTAYAGYLWYNTSTGTLTYYYNATQGWLIGSAQISSVAPGSAPVGSYWYNSTNNVLSVNVVTAIGSPSWKAIVPAPGAAGTVLTSDGTNTAWSAPAITAANITGGTSGQYLVSGGSGSSTWATPVTPHITCTRSSDYTLPGGTVVIPFNSGTGYGGSAAPTLSSGVVSLNKIGIYQINWTVSANFGTGTNYLSTYAILNNTGRTYYGSGPATSNVYYFASSSGSVAIRSTSLTDTVRIYAVPGGSGTVDSGTSHLSVTWLGNYS